MAHFTVRNRCNLPRRAHQLASAYKIWRAPTKYFGLSLAIASTAAVYLFVGLLALLAAHLAEIQGSSSKT